LRRGFCVAEDSNTAVCILPGTELSFAAEIKILSKSLFPWRGKGTGYRTVIFQLINKDRPPPTVPFRAVKKVTKDNKTYLTMNTTKDALKSAPGFKYDRDKTAWVRDTSK
jgi:hypothetical protein